MTVEAADWYTCANQRCVGLCSSLSGTLLSNAVTFREIQRWPTLSQTAVDDLKQAFSVHEKWS